EVSIGGIYMHSSAISEVFRVATMILGSGPMNGVRNEPIFFRRKSRGGGVCNSAVRLGNRLLRSTDIFVQRHPENRVVRAPVLRRRNRAFSSRHARGREPSRIV